MPKDVENFGLNRDALEGALEALAIGPEHGPLVESCRSLAEVVDSGIFNDKAWREYRLALQNLMEATAHSGLDTFKDWLEEWRDQSRAEMGDTADSE